MYVYCSEFYLALVLIYGSIVSITSSPFQRFKPPRITYAMLKEITVYPTGTIEHSTFVSGYFQGGIKRAELKRVADYPSVLSFDKRDPDSQLMTQNCKSKLEDISKMILEIWKGQCILFVQRSFVEDRASDLSSMSLHYDGRSIDMRLVNSTKNTGKYACEKSQKKLAYLGAKIAGFTYVAFKKKPKDSFVHASCRF